MGCVRSASELALEVNEPFLTYPPSYATTGILVWEEPWALQFPRVETREQPPTFNC